MPNKKLYLIDGTSLCYRSHFAIKLNNSSGFPTGAVYGFYRTLKKLIIEHGAEFIAICFDISRKTHRQEKYKDYKIQRPPLPDELKSQFPVIRKLVEALGIKMVEKENYEADDIIASLSKQAVDENGEVVVVSSDKDLYQLLSKKGVSVYNYREQKFYSQNDFIKKYGFSPCYMADYLSLLGDASDNIPGAKGIGKVGATKLIKRFGDIDTIFKNLDKLNSKEALRLKENKEQIILSKELATLSEPKLKVNLSQLKRGKTDKEKLVDMFSKLEFKIPNDQLFNQSKPDSIKIKKGLSFDLKNLQSKQPLAYFIDAGFIYIYDSGRDLVYKEKIKECQKVLSDSSFEKVTLGLKGQMVKYPKIKFEGEIFDIKIASYLVDSSISDYSLPSLTALFLKKYYSNIEPESYPYFIWELYKVLADKLKQEKLDKLFFDIEMPFVKILYKMQSQGITMDIKQLEKVLSQADKKIIETKKSVFKKSKKEFNLNSPKQLQEILFNDLGIKPLKKTKTGYSTSEEVLRALSSDYPIAKEILQYRELSKLKNTYLLPLIKKVSESGDKLYAQFHQTGTQTGRLSSSSPNLQSIPAKGEFSSRLRKAFIPSVRDGFIVCGDYSQIELRILAHISQDKNLTEAFCQGRDIHRFTASLLFNIAETDVEKAQRGIAKKVNFGIVYGMSPYGLSKELGIDFIKAQEFIQNYFSRYPKVKEYIEKVVDKTKKDGYAETIFKRKRKLPQIQNRNPRLQEFAKRQAVNAPIQGSCADIIKIAMLEIDKEIVKKKIGASLIMQIHDELIFDVEKNSLKNFLPVLKEKMENSFNLSVPLKVNIKAGKNWAEVEEIRNMKHEIRNNF
ncbi:MAG: DNA polymerase I [Candidatus Omnitrophica bacterium]|nr:DNA polymerase I [Candidatus Omnitrophota bacterium]MCF7878706.1 DNA polymerase I [Candidatus Omnitrophota bacterium]MCF7893120.1 DNA polymerase I [Candidatus Omnitrophota bacterium]